MTDYDYEARFLFLAARAGYETLRRECHCVGGIRFEGRNKSCRRCQGRGWLPLPEAERVGALVELAGGAEFDSNYGDIPWRARLLRSDDWSEGPTHWAALTEAFLSEALGKSEASRLT